MAVTIAAERIESIPASAPAVRARKAPCRAPTLRVVPGPEALLSARAAEALVLAFRPLSWPR